MNEKIKKKHQTKRTKCIKRIESGKKEESKQYLEKENEVVIQEKEEKKENKGKEKKENKGKEKK